MTKLLPLLLGALILLSCEGGNPPASCEIDNDCRDTSYCVLGVCLPRPITPTCVDGDLNCGSICTTDTDCDYDMFCLERTNTCSKLCVPDEIPCANLGICMENGYCQSTSAHPDAEVYIVDLDSSVDEDAGVCASVTVEVTPVTPTVVLIIDQSASMEQSFMGAGSRWDVLRDFLLSQNGLIESLQDRAQFGLAMYSSMGDSGAPAIGECPLLTSVTPNLDNYTGISQTYLTAEPIDDTPTGDAIDAVIDSITLDPKNPTVFIVATDGEPDTCEQPDPQDGHGEAIAAVERAYNLGITTYIISVGTDISNQHLQDMANAGIGSQGAEFWVAGDAATLETALTSIVVENTLSCDIELEGEITEGDACMEGTVTLNGMDLECGAPNGWELLDSQHIRLLGDACTELKSEEEINLEAKFTCNVKFVIP